MNNKKVGDFINKLRKEKGVTQKDLADYLSVTVQAVSKWERGLGCPDISLLKPISIYFEISLSELLNGEQIKNKNILEKVDDLLVENLKKEKEKREFQRIIFIDIAICIFLIFFVLTMNFYGSIKLIFTILLLTIGIYVPLIYKKIFKLIYLIIPFLLICLLFLFDYIAVSRYNLKPILYYKHYSDIYENNVYEKYNSILYTAYNCNNEIYVIGPKDEDSLSFCKKDYEPNITKNNYYIDSYNNIYYLGISYNDSPTYKGNISYFFEMFNLDNIYDSKYAKENSNESIYKTYPHWNELSEEEKEKKLNHLGPHGDNDPYITEIKYKKDVENIQRYLVDKCFTKKINVDDLKDLELKHINKEDIVNLFNKVINGENKEYLANYSVDRITRESNKIKYEIIYMTYDKKITKVKIKVNGFDNKIINNIENDIVNKNSFSIENKYGKKYNDLIHIIKSIKINK